MDALVDRPDVLAAQPPRDADPHRDEDHVDRRRAAQAEPETGNPGEPLRREAEEQRPAAIRDAVDDDVDRVLERDALRRRNRQIEQLVARLVDREAEPLVEGVGDEHGPEPGHQPDDRRAESERERQDEHGHGDAEAAERRAGHEQLQEEADRPQREVERAEEPRDARRRRRRSARRRRGSAETRSTAWRSPRGRRAPPSAGGTGSPRSDASRPGAARGSPATGA